MERHIVEHGGTPPTGVSNSTEEHTADTSNHNSTATFSACQFGGDSDIWFSQGPEHVCASRRSVDREERPIRGGGGVQWVSSLAPELQHELLHMSDLELEALSSPENTARLARDGSFVEPAPLRDTAATRHDGGVTSSIIACGRQTLETYEQRMVSSKGDESTRYVREARGAQPLEESPFVVAQKNAASVPMRGRAPLLPPSSVSPSSQHAMNLDRLARQMPHLLGVRTWSQQIHDKELARIIKEIKAEQRAGKGEVAAVVGKGGRDACDMEALEDESLHGDVEYALRNVTKLGVRKVALLAFSSYMLGLDAIPTPDRIFHLGVFVALGSAMLLMNSSAMHYVHDPTAVLLMQLGGAVLMVLAMKLQGVAIKLNPGREEALAWAVNAFGFLGSVFCSMQTLRHSDPRWYTVLHYSEPLGVVLLDTLVHHKEGSNVGVKSLMSIVALLSWAVGCRFWLTGRLLPTNPMAGVWGAAWLTIKTFYLVHLKHIVSISKVLPWERVLYANTFAFMILMVSIVVWSSVFHMAEPFEISTIVDLSKLTGESLGVVWASAICGTWLCLSRIVLLEQFSVREYALFSVIALAPARLLQAVPWQQSTA